MTDGIALRFSTQKAVAEQQAFDKATTATFDSILQQSQALANLEQVLNREAAAQKRATQALADRQRVASSVGDIYGSASGEARSAFGVGRLAQDGILNNRALAESQKQVAAESRRAAAAVTGYGKASDTATPLVLKLLGATGQGGAAKALGILSSGFKAVTTGLNPLALATNIVAGSLFTLAANALSARSPVQTLNEQAKEAQKAFTNAAPAIEGFAAGLGRIAGAQGRFTGFESYIEEGKKLEAVQKAISETATEFAERVRRSNDPIRLNVEQVRQLAEVLGKSDQFFRDLESVSRTGNAEALKRLQTEIKLRRDNGALVIDAAEAQRQLAEAYRQAGDQARQLQDSIRFDREAQFQQSAAKIASDLERQLELEKLGNREREVALRLQQQREEILGAGPQTLGQSQSAEQVLAAARAADQRAESEKKLAEAQRASAAAAEESARQRRADIEDQERRRQVLRDSLDALNQETNSLGFVGRAREEYILRLRLEREAKLDLANVDERSGALTEKASRIIDSAISRSRSAAAADAARADALARAAQAGTQYVGVLEQLRNERNELGRPGEDPLERRIREAQRQANASPDSTQGVVIANQVRANEQLRNQIETTERLKDVGRSAFQSIGNSIADAAAQGQTFNQAIESILQNLGRLALQRAFQFAIDAGANAIFGPTTPAGRANGGQLPRRGVPNYFAASGMLLDRFQTLSGGAANVTVAEGGSSTPEIIAPLKKDRFGRWGLINAGGGDTINLVLPGVRSGEEARRIRPTLRQTMASIDRSNRQTTRAGR